MQAESVFKENPWKMFVPPFPQGAQGGIYAAQI